MGKCKRKNIRNEVESDSMGNVSVILTVIDENASLWKTVDTLLLQCEEEIGEIVIVTAERTSETSRKAIRSVMEKYPSKVTTFQQTTPFLGGAIRDAISRVKCEYTLLMSSDLETDPESAKALIEKIHDLRCDAVLASRWLSSGAMVEYPIVKKVLNYLFQGFFKALYRTRLSDLTYGFWIRRTEMLRGIPWEQTSHAFLLECNLRHVLMNYRMHEVPVQWKRRREGKSHFRLRFYLNYFFIGFKIRLLGA